MAILIKTKEAIMIALFLFLTQNLFAQEWITNFEKAKSIAQEENKEILLVFAGSDWCAPCIKLERNIFDTQEFLDYASDNFVLLKADFPRKKANKLSNEQQAHNDRLAEIYNRDGHFPLVLLVNQNGFTIGKTGFKKMSPTEYIKLLESFKG